MSDAKNTTFEVILDTADLNTYRVTAARVDDTGMDMAGFVKFYDENGKLVAWASTLAVLLIRDLADSERDRARAEQPVQPYEPPTSSGSIGVELTFAGSGRL